MPLFDLTVPKETSKYRLLDVESAPIIWTENIKPFYGFVMIWDSKGSSNLDLF